MAAEQRSGRIAGGLSIFQLSIREPGAGQCCGAIATAGGGFLIVAVAIAAADIPTRYAGAFPSSGRVSSITGVFTGATLMLQYTVIRGTTFSPTTANYRCTPTAPSKTYCRGTFQDDDGRYGGVPT